MANLTNKDIEFLSNQELIDILRSVLAEIDIVGSSGAHRSTTYLAVSAIEGLFGEIRKLLELQPVAGILPAGWPIKKTGSPKSVSELTLEETEKVLQQAGALPSYFENLYGPVRVFRNYMHPERELKNQAPIAQSIAQLALACLNALIEKYKSKRFVAKHEWHLEYGVTQVPSNNLVPMPQPRSDNVSLIVCNVAAEQIREITFAAIIPPEAIFNFVYNFFSLNKFMAARIEGRVGPTGRGADNGRVLCTRWRAWRMSGRYTNASEPDPKKRQHVVKIILDPPGTFEVIVDDKTLSFEDGVDWEFDPKGKIGFMTESGPVSVNDINLYDR